MTLGKAILEALDAAKGDPLSARQVLGLIAGDFHPRPTLAEVEGELRVLANRGEAAAQNDDDRGLIHSITVRGRARALR
jgi:hypothetical protein